MKKSSFVIAKNPRKSFIHFFLSTLIGIEGKVAWLEIVFKIISEIQVVAILLYFPFQVIENSITDPLAFFIQKLSQYLCFYDLFDFTTPSWANNVLFTLSAVYLVCMIVPVAIIIGYHVLRKKIGQGLLKIWNSFGIIHYSFIFLLGYQYFLTFMNQLGNDSFTMFGDELNTSFILNVIIRLAPHAILAPLFCRFLYMPLKSDYMASRRTTTPEMLILIFKIIDVPLTVFYDNFRVQRWIRLIIMFVIFTWNACVHINDIPYFHYWPMKVSASFSFVYVALTVSNIILVILGITRNVQSLSSVYLAIVFSMFAIKAADLALKNIIKNSSQEVIEIKSTSDFYRKMFALNFILKKGSNRVKKDQKSKENQYDFMLYGVISQHKKRCTKQVCGCQIVSQSIHGNSEYTTEMESQLERNFRFELRKELYRESLKKMPLNFELRIGFAYFLFQTKTHSDGSSISLMHALDSIHKNIEMQVISSMLLGSIEKKIEKDNDHSVNIKDVVDYQFLSSELKTKIEVNSAHLLHFWELYKSSDLSILQLFWESVKIEKEAKKIDAIWGQITRKYSKLAHQDHLFYGLYQSLVRNAPNTGHKTLLKYFNATKNYDPDRNSDALVTSQNLHEPNNIFVYISMKKDKMGKVHYITYNVENILQYNQQDVIDKNVSMLMPPYFQERHNKYLTAHIEKGRTSALNKNTALFSRKKDGYMMPASVYVNIFPYFQEQLLYVGIIRPTKTFDDFLLVLDDGTIDSFTAAVGKKLGLNPQNERRYHLRDISRDLAKLHRAFLQLVKEDSRKLSSVAPSSRNFSRTQTNLNPNVGTVLDLSRKGESTVIKEDEQTNKYKKQTSNPNSTSRSDGLGKLYEQFTTTGLPAIFKVFGEEELEEDDIDQIRYNTIIGERIIYGSHVRVYQLQPLVPDDSMERPYTVNTTKSVVYTNTSPSKRTNREMSNIASSIPSDDGVNLDKEEEINFRNPFSGDDIGVVSGNREALTSPKELASPKDPLIPLLSAMSQEKLTFDHPITITRNKQDSSYTEIASGAASRVYNKAKTSMPLKLKTLAERESSQQDKVAPKTENNILNESHSIEKSEKHQQVENKNFGHFLKENQLLAAVKGNDPADRGSVASSVKTTKINSKLEHAIYFNDKSLATKMLTVVVLLFCALSVVLLVLDQIVTKANLEKVKNNVEVLELSYERLFYVFEANRRVKRIDFIQRGLAPNNRHVPNYVSFNQQALAGVASNLTYDNSQMRNVIYKIQATELPQFYNLIPVRGKDGKIRQDNTFDLCTEISSTALEIYDMLPTKPAAGDSNIEFILNNTLNGLLVESQNIVSILRADNSASMGNILHTMTGTLITVVVIFAVIFASFVKIEIDFIKAKAHFIEVFLMVKDHEMEVPLYMLNNFYTSLKETKKEAGVLEKLTDDKLAEKARLVKAKKFENKAFKGKKANTKGVNTPTFVNIVFTFIFMSVYWAIFTAILNVFTTTEITINNYRRRTINGKVNNFNYGLALAGLYEYITENGTTNLMDAPISSQWESIYSDLTGNLTTLASYVNDNGEFQAQIEQLLAGNLCQLSVFADQTTCATSVSGVAMKGLLAVNALIITFMRSVKDFFDSSDRSLLATMQALVMQNLLDTEVLFEIYSKRGYKLLDSYMLQQFSTEVDGFQSYITSLIIGSAVILVVITVVCWFYMKKRVEKERLRYRRMLRIIPVSVFLGNRILKNYLLRNSSKILDSVKNRI